ncbi:MAG: TRAP transporter small permease [Rhodospirillales bacterium]|jgi:TRAP-type C4-dicarboxylate transport system permease small subunit|nr:TRAP transporter small permease [Rhodospirillales bacterium]
MINYLSSGLNGIGTLAIFGLMILINWDIFGRALFNSPLKGVPEIVSLSIVGIVFLQIAHSLQKGSFTRSDALFNTFRKRFRKAANFLQGIYHLAGAFIFTMIVKATWPRLISAWQENEYIGTEGYLVVVTWPFRLLIVIGCVATILQLLLLAWRDFRGPHEPLPRDTGLVEED